MPVFSVKVKWGKETFNDVEVNTDETPMLFKAQLFALTGVHPDRQKVMLKGSTLKNDDWGNAALKNGVMILLMGSKEEDLPKEPVQKTVFMEDLSENQLASSLNLPAGLCNLGNTCYMNATIQCLRSVPELRDSLKKYEGSSFPLDGTPHAVVLALRDLFNTMDTTSVAIPPFTLVQVIHTAIPRFAEKSEHGGFVQQDANECWSEVVRFLQQKLLKSSDPKSEAYSVQSKQSIIDLYFGGVFDVTLKCNESESEPPINQKENFLQLSCFISQEVKYMHSGLKLRMQETITKFSPTFDRDALYTKTSKLSRLPAYLTVQFVRFYYKEKESINAKILKEVKFPLTLDVFDLCSTELQQKLTPMRTRFKEIEDRALEMQEVTNKGKRKPSENEKKKNTVKVPFSFEDDEGSNNSGYYELQAVLTHKGRSSSSGHYVAWVRHNGDTWLQCDDDKTNPVTSEDILKLCGGGDWHCAYVLLYGPRILEVEKEAPEAMDESK